MGINDTVLAPVQAFRYSGMEIEVGVMLCLRVSIKLIWKEAGLEKRTLEMRESSGWDGGGGSVSEM